MYKKSTFAVSLILLFVLLLTSCGSKRNVVLPANFKGPKELSRLYGVKITPNDNIYLYNAGSKWLGVPHRMGGNTPLSHAYRRLAHRLDQRQEQRLHKP